MIFRSKASRVDAPARPAAPPTSRPPAPPAELRLRVDAVACDGIGVCAHLAPRVIELDRWGFPLVTVGAMTPKQAGDARRAVQGCPRRALWIETVPPGTARAPAPVSPSATV